MTIQILSDYLDKIYSKDTCYSKCCDNWTPSNPTFGHCAIVTLLVNDYFGGEIYKIKVDGISHYFNYIDSTIVDLTASQFNKNIDYSGMTLKSRKEILSDAETLFRYNILKMRFNLLLVDNDIHKCSLCTNMIEKFPNSKTVSIGKKSDILILGEAPANNGWRKSGIAWYDVEHKLLPSGVVLQKLLDEINLKIEDTYFLEAIKCFPKNRKYLSKCGVNCKKYLLRQLEVIKPKVILALGDAATKTIVDIKYKKFSDVVGKVFDVDGYKIIPIYNPSPISPMSYKGNIEIFKNVIFDSIKKADL